jgi:hypothetical protein
MTPEEKFRRLRDESLWHEIRLPQTPRPVARSRVWQFAIPVVSGLVVAVLVIAGVNVLRGVTPQPPVPVPTSTSAADPFAEAVPVDPADYTSTWYDTPDVEGVDFDIAGGIHCGIYDPYFPDIGVESMVAPFAGCAPTEQVFEFPVATGGGGKSASAVTMWGTAESAAVAKSDVQFGGEQETVPVLEQGSSITWSTVTCAAIDDGVECRNDESGHSFFISNSMYSVDSE